MELFIFDATEKFLLTGAGLLFLIQLFFYGYAYSRMARHNKATEHGENHFTQEQPPLSVILYAHEDLENLRQNLPAVLEQDYPQYEVIVITDGQDDGSEEFLTQLEERYPHLYHSFIPDSSRYISRKKLAVTLGIKASKYEWMVLTEANCQPKTNLWLQRLARNFTPRTEIVLGYNSYERGKGWFHKRVCFDNLFTGMRYLGAALNGHPYMGQGKNLAYRKKLFFQHKGLSAHLNLQRGDDDLFINQAASSNNTRVECSAESIVRSKLPSHKKEWREEKVGYRSTARLYHGIQRWMYGFETTTRLGFHLSWIMLIILGISHHQWMVMGAGILLFLLRWAIQGIVFYQTTQSLQEERRYFWSLPVFDLWQPMQSFRWNLYYSFRKKSDFMRK